VAAAWAPAEGKVTDARGRSTRLPLERSGSRLFGAFEQTAEPGYYTVEVRGARADQPKEGTLAFAVNLSPEESETARITQDQLQKLLPTAQVTFVDASAEAQQLFGSVGNEQEVYRWLIWLLFLIIGVEFTLATLGGQSRDAEQPATVAGRLRRLSPGSWLGRMTGATASEPSE
jgi:hypothetical protein